MVNQQKKAEGQTDNRDDLPLCQSAYTGDTKMPNEQCDLLSKLGKNPTRNACQAMMETLTAIWKNKAAKDKITDVTKCHLLTMVTGHAKDTG